MRGVQRARPLSEDGAVANQLSAGEGELVLLPLHASFSSIAGINSSVLG